MENAIGLNPASSKNISEGLNDLLAQYQLFYINARGFHWNIAGEHFFELHVKFEELYNDALLKIDEIAERILTLGNVPLHSFTEYLKRSAITEATNISEGREAIKIILDGFRMLLETERNIWKLAGDANDEGTAAMMSDYIRGQEKLVWMYQAYLK